MSPAAAPTCGYPYGKGNPRGCQNKTWDVRCYQHLSASATAGGGVDSRVAEPPRQYHNGGNLASIEASARRVFPDLPLDRPLETADLRAQAVGALTAAVSLDVFREFPKTNSIDPNVRDAALRKYGYDLETQYGHIEDVYIRDEDVADVARSTSDNYGMPMADLHALSDYGFRKEWELARVKGLDYDQDGIAYGQTYSDWVKGVNNTNYNPAQMAIRDEFNRQLVQYDRVIYETTGAEPISPVSMSDYGIDQVPITRIPNLKDEAEVVHTASSNIRHLREEKYARELKEEQARRDAEERRRNSPEGMAADLAGRVARNAWEMTKEHHEKSKDEKRRRKIQADIHNGMTSPGVMGFIRDSYDLTHGQTAQSIRRQRKVQKESDYIRHQTYKNLKGHWF